MKGSISLACLEPQTRQDYTTLTLLGPWRGKRKRRGGDGGEKKQTGKGGNDSRGGNSRQRISENQAAVKNGCLSRWRFALDNGPVQTDETTANPASQ